MFTVNVSGRKEGIVWQVRDHLNSCLGPNLTIKNQPSSNIFHPYNGANQKIVCACIEYPRILTGDVNGTLYLFNLQNNWFLKLTKLSNCCTALAFANSLHPNRDILAACSNGGFYVIDAKGVVVAKLQGHKSPITHISVDKQCYIALTSSMRQTLVWDLSSLKLRQEIVLPLDIDLVKSVLVPPYETIISVYKRDKICFWDNNTHKYTMSFEINTQKMDSNLVVSSVDVSRDGKLLLLGGHSNWLLYWQLDALKKSASQPLIVSLSKSIKSVSKLAFVNLSFSSERNIYPALVLGQDGVLYLYEIITNKLLRKIQDIDHSFVDIHCSTNSDKVIAISYRGFAKVYNIEDLVSGCFDNVEENPAKIERKLSERDEIVAGQHLKKDGKSRVRYLVSPLTMERLKGILKEFGKFPDKYRYIIWSNFLDLPDNSDTFKAYYSLELHKSSRNINENASVVDPTLNRAFQKILSMLYWWCPQLVEIDCVKYLVFPFVKLLHRNLHLCFEVVIAVFCKWAFKWFMDYPRPNVQILIACEALIMEHDGSLLHHLLRSGLSPQEFAWGLLNTLFSEVLDDKAWIKLVDHLVANPSDFLIYLVAAFNIVMRRTLFNCRNRDNFAEVYTTTSEVDISSHLISKAYQLYQGTSYQIREQIKDSIGFKHRAFNSNREYPNLDLFPSITFDYEKEQEAAQMQLEQMKNRQEMILEEQFNNAAQQDFVQYNGDLNFDYGSDVPRGVNQSLNITRDVLSRRCQIANLKFQKCQAATSLYQN